MARLAGARLAGALLAGALLVGGGIGEDTPDVDAPDDPLLSWGTNFVAAAEDPAESGWEFYKPGAVALAMCDSDGLHLEAEHGGGGDYQGGSADPLASFWFSASNSDQRDGFLMFKPIGPGAGTSVGWDVRARLIVRNGAGTANPPGTVGEWRFAVLAVHDPDRATHLRYLHVGLGSEGLVATVGDECKANRVNATGGASVYPVEALVGALDYDVRIVRREDEPQIFEIYIRAVSSGELLESDEGWILRYVVDWADGESGDDTFPACPQETDAGMPSTVHVGLSLYSNVAGHDISVTCPEIVALPLAA